MHGHMNVKLVITSLHQSLQYVYLEGKTGTWLLYYSNNISLVTRIQRHNI